MTLSFDSHNNSLTSKIMKKKAKSKIGISAQVKLLK
jgi:hypothetical protein